MMDEFAGSLPSLSPTWWGQVDTRMVFCHYRHPVTPTIDVDADHIDRAIKG